MEINFLEQFIKPNERQVQIFFTSEGFKLWHKKYISCIEVKQIVDQLYYSSSQKEISVEQKQFLLSRDGNQIKKLILQFNHVKLSVADEANIRFLLNSLIKLQQLHFSSKSSQVSSQIISILMEGREHLQKLNVIKFKNDFYSISSYSRFLRIQQNLQSLKLCIPSCEGIELDIISDPQCFTNLSRFSVSFAEFQQHIENKYQQQMGDEKGENNQAHQFVDIVLNKVIEMNNLSKLTLNISQKLKTLDSFLLLNQSLSLKKHLKRLSIDLSYHTINYNIANILQLSQNINKISLNCNSSYAFRFDELNDNLFQFKQQVNYQYLLLNNSSNQPIKTLQKMFYFKYKHLEVLKLKLNFTKSSLVNRIFSFLMNQTPQLKTTLKIIHLELNFIYPNLCLQQVGQFISKLESIEELDFQCNSENVDYMRDNIYILRQIVKLKRLKRLTFYMKVTCINSDYSQLVYNLTEQCQNIEINIYKGIGLQIVDKNNLAIYTIKRDYSNYNAQQLSIQNDQDILEYIVGIFSNRSIKQLFIQLSDLQGSSYSDISKFVSRLSNIRILEVLNINIYKFKLSEVRLLIKRITLSLPSQKLMKVLSIQNRNFSLNDFREEYYGLVSSSISYNLFLKSINLENYSNQLYDDYQLLYLQNLLNFKSKLARILFLQIRSIINKWPNYMRKQIIIDLISNFFV